MEALRLKLFQETACYKKPFAFKVGETYPLPPYSTIKGMLHAVMEATDFVPMRISVQGTYDAMATDYQTYYFFKKRNVDEFPMILDGLSEKPDFKEMTKMPIYLHMLYGVNLIIHVAAEKPILEKIIVGMETGETHLSLGRWEDLVRIDEYKRVKIIPLTNGEEVELENNIYIPLSIMPDKCDYVPYRLNWKYSIKNNVRHWEKIGVGYVRGGYSLEGKSFLIDEDESYPIIFHDMKK